MNYKRKATYIIIAIIVLKAGIDFIYSFGNERTDEEFFAKKLLLCLPDFLVGVCKDFSREE